MIPSNTAKSTDPNFLTILTSLLFMAVMWAPLSATAQDCSSVDDCLAKAKQANVRNDKMEYYEAAIKRARKKEKDKRSLAYLERGIYRYKQIYGNSEDKDTRKDFEKSIKYDDQNFDAHSWLVEYIKTKEEDYEGSDEYLTDLFERFPNDSRVYYYRAMNHWYWGYHDKAITDFEMAMNLAKSTDTSPAWQKANMARFQAYSYLRKNNQHVRDNRTVEILEKGVAMVPNNADLQGELALAYYDIEAYDKALGAAQQAANYGENHVGRFVLGMQTFSTSHQKYQQDRQNGQVQSSSGNRYFYNELLHFEEALRQSVVQHPLITYYSAYTRWLFVTVDQKGSRWSHWVGPVRDRFQHTLRYAEGTKYKGLISNVQQLLQQLR